MSLEKLTSAVYNNVMSGMRGMSINAPFTLQQVEDSVITERLTVIKEYASKNLIPIKDLMYSIRCIDVNCESLDRCPCGDIVGDKIKHIEIPQPFNDFGGDAIDYIGTTDGLLRYKVYTDDSFRVHKHRRRGADKPYVWIDVTPNANNMCDAYIFNSNPLLNNLLVRMIVKDPRQLYDYDCCTDGDIFNFTFIDGQIEKNLTERYIRWYRQMAMPITANDQTIKV